MRMEESCNMCGRLQAPAGGEVSSLPAFVRFPTGFRRRPVTICFLEK